jgi:hypothetical protein
MVKHLLFWKLKDYAEGRSKAENIDILRQRVLALPQSIPEIRAIEFGTNFATVAAAFDLAVTVQFADKAGFEVFLDHPDHAALGQAVSVVRESWAVVDYEIERTEPATTEP